MQPEVAFSVSAPSGGHGLRPLDSRQASRRPDDVPCPVRVDGRLPGGGPKGLGPALWKPVPDPHADDGREDPVAIYSMHVSNVSHSAGSSSVASLSYITSRRMRDERTGETFHGYGHRERVLHVATLLPEGAPREWNDPERLFNAVEAAERRLDARPAKKIMVALPRELTGVQRIEAVESFIRRQLTACGYAATYAIHEDKAGNNPHAHIIVANRRISPTTGRWAAKSRSEFALDEHGQRIPVIDPETGLQKVGARNRKVWKRVTVSNNPLDSKETLELLRAEWARTCNRLLPEGIRIDHRSLEAQGTDRIPTVHEGYASREITARGGRSVLRAVNDRIIAANRLLDSIRERLRDLGRRLSQLVIRSMSEPEPPVEATAPPARTPDPSEALTDELARARRELAEMDEQWRTTPPQEVLEVQRIIDVACEACLKAENAGLLSRGRLRRAAARTVAEQSELLRRTAPWLKDAAIPGTYAGAAAYRDEASPNHLGPRAQAVPRTHRQAQRQTRRRTVQPTVRREARTQPGRGPHPETAPAPHTAHAIGTQRAGIRRHRPEI